VTGLIVSAELNAQPTLSGVLVVVMVPVKPIAINHVMIVNPIAVNAVQTI